VQYINDGMADNMNVSDKQVADLKAKIYKPLDNYTIGRNEIVGGTVSPSYILPIQGLQRLEKIMDEYCGGIGVNYMTNDKLLNIGVEKLKIFEEDLENIGAEDLHQLMRAWELKHRHRTSESVMQHTLFRKETRWPGYYYRGDALKLDDENWHALTVSHRNRDTGEYTMEKAPVYHIVDEDE
jgi:adenylylsulfate reductase subunit A